MAANIRDFRDLPTRPATKLHITYVYPPVQHPANNFSIRDRRFNATFGILCYQKYFSSLFFRFRTQWRRPRTSIIAQKSPRITRQTAVALEMSNCTLIWCFCDSEHHWMWTICESCSLSRRDAGMDGKVEHNMSLKWALKSWFISVCYIGLQSFLFRGGKNKV